MSFGIALSGINAAQSDLNVTANNIANSNTTRRRSCTERKFIYRPRPTDVSRVASPSIPGALRVRQHNHGAIMPRPT